MISFRCRRIGAGLVLGAGVWVAARAGSVRAQEEAAGEAAVEAATPAAPCSAQLAKLQEEHKRLLADYKNAVAQARALLVYKREARDADDVRRQFEMQGRKREEDRQEAVKKAEGLARRVENLNADIVKLREERDTYKNSFEKATVENIIEADAQKKIDALEEERRGLSKRIEEFEDRVKLLEHEGLKREAEAERLRRQLGEVKERYAEARKSNAILEQRLRRAPKRAAELARENKILVKRTALMHYNLGVFYTQNKEFERAVKEFEKAVELNPQDAASFFNLGYIYAEHLENRPKAVEHFRQYLKLAQKNDKDADWAKRYILTWQTWEGKVPIK